MVYLDLFFSCVSPFPNANPSLGHDESTAFLDGFIPVNQERFGGTPTPSEKYESQLAFLFPMSIYIYLYT